MGAVSVLARYLDTVEEERSQFACNRAYVTALLEKHMTGRIWTGMSSTPTPSTRKEVTTEWGGRGRGNDRPSMAVEEYALERIVVCQRIASSGDAVVVVVVIGLDDD